MNRAFPAATVQGFEAVIPTIVLPDPDDRHVVAAGMHAGADSIVTFNTHHFPEAALQPHGIVAVHSDDFIDNLFALEEDEAVLAIAKVRRRLRAPSMTAEEYTMATRDTHRRLDVRGALTEHDHRRSMRDGPIPYPAGWFVRIV